MITIISDTIWSYLWMFIVITSFVGLWAFNKVRISNDAMNEKEKKVIINYFL